MEEGFEAGLSIGPATELVNNLAIGMISESATRFFKADGNQLVQMF